ncbi:type II secretion system protein [Actinomadura madurae]|uniref:type II secretion system protein n=1 Tax=Actinomadura madurae TaxID=1993 RepID=UPI0020D25C92|nr:type II secretion system protein [Actinomadura madurae]MCP9967414.1 type II secretion system protein [Actinomadura madurae]
MNGAMIAGAVVGLGLYVLVRALFPSRPGLAARMAALDAARRRDLEEQQASRLSPTLDRVGGTRARLGRELARFCEARGWKLRSVRADLAITGRSLEAFLATKFLLPAAALLFIPLIVAYFTLLGLGSSVAVPAWICVLFAALFFFFPDMQLRQEAQARRQDFRHVVGAFLDLVSMNLAGGRGVPEALMTASNVGEGWAMHRIRDALSNARITGQTPWQSLGGSARNWTSPSCATSPGRSRSSPTTARRSASRSPRGPRPCAAASCRSWRARPASAPSRCSSRSCSCAPDS